MVKSGEVAWVQPKDKGTRPGPRSGHTTTCTREKAIIFGGCGVQEGRSAIFNETYILHISDGFRWELADVTGDVPSPRWRHTATLLPDNNSILVFGGLCKGKRFNDTHVFDVDAKEWKAMEIAGYPPHPRSHHTATLVEFDEEEDGEAEKKIFIIGGYGGVGSCRDFSMDVVALDLDTWTWSKLERLKGPAPKPRADHAVSVAGNQLILSGGRGASAKGFSGYFDDVHVLDLAEQEWKRPPGYQPGAADAAGGGWPALPSPLWNHTAQAIESVPSYKMFVFGGQKKEFDYSGTVSVLDTGRMVWTAPVIAGTPPDAREDCSVSYDAKTCNLVYFGGWRQGWLDDLWCLNVAGIVGPPYAVQSVEPATGPVTGNTPVIVKGLGFVESTMVQVKFSDGKREATVAGKYVSPEQARAPPAPPPPRSPLLRTSPLPFPHPSLPPHVAERIHLAQRLAVGGAGAARPAAHEAGGRRRQRLALPKMEHDELVQRLLRGPLLVGHDLDRVEPFQGARLFARGAQVQRPPALLRAVGARAHQPRKDEF